MPFADYKGQMTFVLFFIASAPNILWLEDINQCMVGWLEDVVEK